MAEPADEPVGSAQGDREFGAREYGTRLAKARQAELAPLIARMAQGDEAAMSSFYDAMSSRVYGFALRICGNTALAEEVTADTFYQAWTGAIRYDPTRAKVMTWLLMMVRSRAIDTLRARDSALLHEAPESLVDEAEQPRAIGIDDLLEAAQSNARLAALLGKLNPVQRQLIALAFYQGLSHSEIAVHAKMPLGTVKAHIRRGLGALKEALLV